MESSVVLHEGASRKREYTLYADAQHPLPTNKDSSMHTMFFSAESVEGLYMKDYHSLFIPAGLDLMTSLLGALQPYLKKDGLVLTINLDFKYA
jgi:hypothetical protein